MNIIREEIALNRSADHMKSILTIMVNITDGDNSCIQETIGESAKELKDIINALLNPATNPEFIHPMIKFVGGVSTGDDWHTTTLITLKALDALDIHINS